MIKLPTITAIFGVPMVFLFGTWSPLMGVLLVMISIDILTGIAKGLYNKELRSRNMSQGMIRKAMIFVVIIIANMLDVAVFAGLPVAKSAVISFYIGMEGLSVIENLVAMDMPVPAFITQYLKTMKENGNQIKQVDEITIKTGNEEYKLETTNKDEKGNEIL